MPGVVLGVLWTLAPVRAEPVLTLAEAERLALQQDPVAAQIARQAQAKGDEAVADGELPDPTFGIGAAAVPVDTFDFNQEPMTRLNLALTQRFPPGKTLAYRRRAGESRSRAQRAQADDRQRKVRLEVRRAYYELYFQHSALTLVRDSRQLFARLVEVTRAHYRAGEETQQDVLRAQLELSRLDEREAGLLEAMETARADLNKWIGERADAPLPEQLPEPGEPSLQDAERVEALREHPLARAAAAEWQARRHGIAEAREQYKPDIGVSLTYGVRFGTVPGDPTRPDLLAGMVTFDLPLFTGDRQDRRVAAATAKADAAMYAREDVLRELRRRIRREGARWRRLRERYWLFNERLVPEAQQNAQAAERAYRSGVRDFTTVMRARLTELELKTQMLRLDTNRAAVQAELLYLTADEPNREESTHDTE